MASDPPGVPSFPPPPGLPRSVPLDPPRGPPLLAAAAPPPSPALGQPLPPPDVAPTHDDAPYPRCPALNLFSKNGAGDSYSLWVNNAILTTRVIATRRASLLSRRASSRRDANHRHATRVIARFRLDEYARVAQWNGARPRSPSDPLRRHGYWMSRSAPRITALSPARR